MLGSNFTADSLTRGKTGKLSCNMAGAAFFNISHTRNASALILSQVAEVGIDIEWLDPTFNFEETLDIVFSPEEKEDYFAISNKDKRSYFYKI